MKPLVLPKLEKLETDKRDRFRRAPDGRWLPSATTILRAAPQPWMANWAAKVERELMAECVASEWNARWLTPAMVDMDGKDFAASVLAAAGKPYAHERVSRAAANIGTEAHAMIEWRRGREMGDNFTPAPTIGYEASIAFGQWLEWREKSNSRAIAVECDVYNLEAGYSGKADEIATDGARLVLRDWKSSKEIHLEAHLQCASYIKAARSMGIDVEDGEIVRLPKAKASEGFEVVPVGHVGNRRYTVDELYEVFLNVKAVWSFWNPHAGPK